MKQLLTILLLLPLICSAQMSRKLMSALQPPAAAASCTTPSAITGTAFACVGFTSTLSSTPSGGTWSSATPSRATVDAIGVVTAVSAVSAATAGTSVITYSTGAGCSVTKTFSANPTPVPTFITVTNPVCTGSQCTYRTQSGGGINNYVWTVPGTVNVDYTIFSGGFGSSNGQGIVLWITPGQKTITVSYTNSFGCPSVVPATTTNTVNLTPTATWVAQPGATTSAMTDVAYTTQSGQSNYVWTVTGSLGVNYSITSGGFTTTDPTATIQWFNSTIGQSKTITVKYTAANSCVSNTLSNSTTVTP